MRGYCRAAVVPLCRALVRGLVCMRAFGDGSIAARLAAIRIELLTLHQAAWQRNGGEAKQAAAHINTSIDHLRLAITVLENLDNAKKDTFNGR
jgi:hypothetical protein